MNKSFITNFIALLATLAGYFLEQPLLFTVGLFALSGAFTNWIAVHMLFEKVPLLYGSGVIPARFEDFNLLRAAALSGQGVALCPAAMVQPDIDAGSLVQLSDDRAAGMGEYYLVTRAATSHSLAKQVEIFSDWAMAAR